MSRTLVLKHPIIQAPMAGGATTPELVAAVSNAGGLGSFAAALLAPDQISAQVKKIRELTDKPFAVNLFVLAPPAIKPGGQAENQVREAITALEDSYHYLETTPPTLPNHYCQDNQAQLDCVLALAPPVVSFAFDLLPQARVEDFQDKGCYVIGTATNLEEALAWQAAGADAICAQGSEAGGHRGTFIGDFEQSNIGLLALLSTLAPHIKVPLIAAGGIMNGQAINACHLLGATFSQLGTAFLNCPESGIHPAYKARLKAATDKDTRLTRVFSGKYARGIVNEFMEMNRDEEQNMPEYPIQNALTGALRQAAAEQDNTEYMSLWAGQGVDLIRDLPAAELVRQLYLEMQD